MRHLHRLALAAFAVAIPIQTACGQFPAEGQEVVVETSNGLPIGVPETTGGVYGEPLQRYDAQFPWMHGYFQEIPPYSGYAAFRPYNYKHVLSQSQSQAAGGWGESPTMPYAQQFWHRYRQRARLLPDPAVSESATATPALSSRSRYRSPGTGGGPLIIPAAAMQRSRNR
jgi:hypothetical protein